MLALSLCSQILQPRLIDYSYNVSLASEIDSVQEVGLLSDLLKQLRPISGA